MNKFLFILILLLCVGSANALTYDLADYTLLSNLTFEGDVIGNYSVSGVNTWSIADTSCPSGTNCILYTGTGADPRGQAIPNTLSMGVVDLTNGYLVRGWYNNIYTSNPMPSMAILQDASNYHAFGGGTNDGGNCYLLNRTEIAGTGIQNYVDSGNAELTLIWWNVYVIHPNLTVDYKAYTNETEEVEICGQDGIANLAFSSGNLSMFALRTASWDDIELWSLDYVPILHLNNTKYPGAQNLYRMENFTDIGSLGEDMTADLGTPTVVAGKFNKAYNYNGAQAHSAFDTGILADGVVNFSASVWAKTSDFGGTYNKVVTDESASFVFFTIEQHNQGMQLRFKNGAGSVLQVNTSWQDDGLWHHFAYTYDDDSDILIAYYDGQQSDNVTVVGESLIGGAGDSRARIGGRFTGGNLFNGSIDDVVIWRNNLILSPTAVLDIFDTGNGTVSVVPNTITVDAVAPANNTQFNTQTFTINVTYTSTNSPTVRLFINDILNETLANAGSGTATHVFNFTFGSDLNATFDYFFSVNHTTAETNSTLATFYVDNVDPMITWTSPANDNSTVFDNLNLLFVTNISFTDTNLFSYQYNITNLSGVVIYNVSNSSLTGVSTVTLDQQINFTSQTGNLTAMVRVTDGHTESSIDNFTRAEVTKDSLIFDDAGENIEIKFKQALLTEQINVTKQTDRYNFDFVSKIPLNVTSFTVTADVPIVILNGKTEYPGHLIIGEKWVDFVTNCLARVEVTRVSDYEVEVTVYKSIATSYWFFSSIGELNVVLEERKFQSGLDDIDFVDVNITLDSQLSDRKYEIGSNATIVVTTAVTSGTGHSPKLCLNIGKIKNYTCFYHNQTPYTFDYTVPALTLSNYNDTTSNITLSSNNITLANGQTTFYTLNSSAAVLYGSVGLFGVTLSGNYPTNISYDYDSDGIMDDEIPCSVRENTVYCNEFIVSTSRVVRANLTYTTAGSKVINLNLSRRGWQDFVSKTDLNYTNISMKIVSIEKNNGQNFSYITAGNSTDWSVTVAGVNSSATWSTYQPWEGPYKHVIDMDGCTATGYSIINCEGHDKYGRILTNVSAIDIKDVWNVSITVQTAGSYRAVGYVQIVEGTNFKSVWSKDSVPGTYTINIVKYNKVPSQYEVYENGVYITNVNVESLNQSANWSIAGRFTTTTSLGSGSMTFKDLSFSSYLLERDGTGHKLTGEVTSNATKTFTQNISSVLLDATVDLPADNMSVVFYVSATNGTDWTTATNGVETILVVPGPNLKWKFDVNITDSTSLALNRTPRIHDIKIQVLGGLPSNITVDLLSDGSDEFVLTTPLTGNNQSINFSIDADPIGVYINSTCQTALTCLVPIKITLDTSGIIEVQDVNLTFSAIELVLNSTKLDTAPEKNIIQVNYSNGNLTLTNLNISYHGSGNIVIEPKEVGDSFTGSIRAILARFSKFYLTLPQYIDFWAVYPATASSKNVEPFGQNSTVGIWNITSDAYDDPFDVYLRLNQSLDACVDIQSSLTSTTASTKKLNFSNGNDTALLIEDLNVSQRNYIWQFVNLTSCTAFSSPVQVFDSFCADCVRKLI